MSKANQKTTKTKNTTKATSGKSTPQLTTSGRMYIKATFNNTLVTFTDDRGNVISWTNTGSVGFKGTRKSTPYAATTTIEEAIKKAKEKGINSIQVYVKGPGPGRDAVLRVLRNSGLDINMIADVTPIPHNGCRPKKPRRA
jgi:small subunit ribosomal protein S11